MDERTTAMKTCMFDLVPMFELSNAMCVVVVAEALLVTEIPVNSTALLLFATCLHALLIAASGSKTLVGISKMNAMKDCKHKCR